MKNFESKSYLLQFMYGSTEHIMPVSEVALADNRIAYVVKMPDFKGLFIKNGSQWTVRSKGIILESLKKQIIRELRFYQYKLLLIDMNRMHMHAII